MAPGHPGRAGYAPAAPALGAAHGKSTRSADSAAADLQAHWIPTLPSWRDAIFAGYFGPIGVGAVFYTQVALEALPEDGSREHLRA